MEYTSTGVVKRLLEELIDIATGEKTTQAQKNKSVSKTDLCDIRDFFSEKPLEKRETKKNQKKRKQCVIDKSPKDEHVEVLKRKARRIKSKKEGQASGVSLGDKEAIDQWWKKRSCTSKCETQGQQAQLSPIPLKSLNNSLSETDLEVSSCASTESEIASPDEQTLLELHQILQRKQQDSEKDKTAQLSSKGAFEVEMENATNPKAMDISMVFEMFKELKNDVSKLEKASKNIASEVSTKINSEVQEQLSNFEEVQNKKVREITQEMDKLKYTNKVLVNTVEEVCNELKDLELRVENLELNAAKRTITISNFECGEKKWQRIQALYSLFNEFPGTRGNY